VFTFRGEWVTGTTYNSTDLVEYSSILYGLTNTGSYFSETIPPDDPTNWYPFAPPGPTGLTGATGATGPRGVTGAVGPGMIITYYEDSGATITPSLNTSIRVIAGPYWSNQGSNNVQLTMPTPTASNDYLNVEFVVSFNALDAGYYGYLNVTFPSANTHSQNHGNTVNYIWDSNAYASYWTVVNYYGSVTYTQ
jgi:hypothetical protein